MAKIGANGHEEIARWRADNGEGAEFVLTFKQTGTERSTGRKVGRARLLYKWAKGEPFILSGKERVGTTPDVILGLAEQRIKALGFHRV